MDGPELGCLTGSGWRPSFLDRTASPRRVLSTERGERWEHRQPRRGLQPARRPENNRTTTAIRALGCSDDGWVAIPDPARVTVPAGDTAKVNVTVRAPASATVGTQGEHVVTLEPEREESIGFTTTTDVLPGEGFLLLLPGEELEASEASLGEHIGDVFSEVWVEALATMIVGGLVTVAHLVRRSAQ